MPKPFTQERIDAWRMYYGEHEGKALTEIPVEYLIEIVRYTEPEANVHRAVQFFLRSGMEAGRESVLQA